MKFIFPTAPSRPIQMLLGMSKRCVPLLRPRPSRVLRVARCMFGEFDTCLCWCRVVCRKAGGVSLNPRPKQEHARGPTVPPPELPV